MAGGPQCAGTSNRTFISPHRLLKVARLYLEENWRFKVEMKQELSTHHQVQTSSFISQPRGKGWNCLTSQCYVTFVRKTTHPT